MCGRSANNLGAEAVARRVGARRVQQRRRKDFRPSANVSPSSVQPVLRRGESSHEEIAFQTWGVRLEGQRGASGGGALVSNTRSEAAQRRRLLEPRRRVVYVCEGFYEWQDAQGDKQPHYFHDSRHDAMLLMAAVSCERGDAFSVLTRAADSRLAWCHERMPVLLTREQASEWLHPSTSAQRLAQLLGCAADEPQGPDRSRVDLVHHAVSDRVGNVRNQGEELRKPVAPKARSKKITSFFSPPPGKKKRKVDSES